MQPRLEHVLVCGEIVGAARVGGLSLRLPCKYFSRASDAWKER